MRDRLGMVRVHHGPGDWTSGQPAGCSHGAVGVLRVIPDLFDSPTKLVQLGHLLPHATTTVGSDSEFRANSAEVLPNGWAAPPR